MPKIIILEDNRVMSSLLTTLLELQGYQVQAHTEIHLEEFFANLREVDPQALIMDVYMQGINGFEVLKTLRQKEEFQTLPVLMTSGSDIAEKCLQAGATGFLMKPFMPEELTSWLHENIQNSPPARIP